MPSRWAWTACLLCCAALFAQQAKEDPITHRATGPFEVKLTPQSQEQEDTALVRMAIDKQYHGELEAVSRGQMLSASTSTTGSAGYVAMEMVTGRLGGRDGTFILQHSGTMDRGQPQLSLTVVPGSGMGELRGLRGSMKIRNEPGGRHFYDFDYEILDLP